MTTYETVNLMLTFSMFIIALLSLIVVLIKAINKDKK